MGAAWALSEPRKRRRGGEHTARTLVKMLKETVRKSAASKGSSEKVGDGAPPDEICSGK